MFCGLSLIRCAQIHPLNKCYGLIQAANLGPFLSHTYRIALLREQEAEGGGAHRDGAGSHLLLSSVIRSRSLSYTGYEIERGKKALSRPAAE